MEGSSGQHRIGVDIGGTFTDLVVFDDASGSFAVGKTLTTPRDPSQAVEPLVLETLERERIATGSVQQLIHGTTLVTNAIIERTGSHTALLSTQGFHDSIEIGRENRYELYDLMLEMPSRWCHVICALGCLNALWPVVRLSRAWMSHLSSNWPANW